MLEKLIEEGKIDQQLKNSVRHWNSSLDWLSLHPVASGLIGGTLGVAGDYFLSLFFGDDFLGSHRSFYREVSTYIWPFAFGFIGGYGSSRWRRTNMELREANAQMKKSERHLKTLVEMNPSAIIIASMNGEILYSNPIAERMFEVPEISIGMLAASFYRDENERNEFINKVGANGNVNGLDIGMQTLHKKPLDVTVSGSLINWDGQDAIITAITDITERKRMLEEIAMSEERFRTFAAAGSDWLWEQGPSLEFTYFSGNFHDATRLSPERLLGKTRQDITIKESLIKTDWELLKDATKRRNNFKNFIYPYRNDSGEVEYAEISGIARFDKTTNDFLGYIGVGRNVTQKVLTDQDLKEAREAAEAANRAKSEFLANMSHEFRTPLNAIIGFAELMLHLKDFSNKKTREWIGDIHNSGMHLLDIVNRVLDLANIDAGKVYLQKEPYTIAELMERPYNS